ncbi:MAG TPA: pentapeptide repeat-containing protein [Candidatus Binatia bacterium]|nr:pentapeptide repeat-containing protein [Candidatus Binatia bacterium]
MKRATLAACLLAFASVFGGAVYAQAPSATDGPTLNQEQRDDTAIRVRAGDPCAGCDLFQIDLAYQNVAGRDFSGSRIRQSNFSAAIADGTRFRGANLSLANLFGLRAGRADFTDANLEGATLVGGYFSGARFDGAVLTGANLSGAELEGAHGLTQEQLNTACGDATTSLPAGMTAPNC